MGMAGWGSTLEGTHENWVNITMHLHGDNGARIAMTRVLKQPEVSARAVPLC